MNYKKKILPNGLRLITIPMPSVASVTVIIVVGAGSRYEEKNINGLSHFLEHMAFKGTAKRPSALEISSIIDGIGGEFNAFTTKDHTGYYIKAAAKHLPLLLDVLSDMLLHSKFDPAEIERERGVIIEEINLYEDTPIRKIGDLYENLLYGDTKLGRDVAGRKEAIRRIKREDFLSYIDRFYCASNTIVAIAGGIGNNLPAQAGVTMKPFDYAQGKQCNSEELLPRVGGFQPRAREGRVFRASNETMKDLVEKYLSEWNGRKVERPAKANDRQDKPQLLVKYKDTNQAHLCLGVRSYHLTHPDRFALSVLTNILGGGMSSRLFIAVRERRGLAYYVRSSNEEYEDVGNFVTQAGVDTKRIDDALKVMLEEFAKIKEEKVREGELVKAKENLKGRLILELEDSKSVAALFASEDLLEKRILTPEDLMKKVDEVTIFDIKKIAGDIFRQETLNLAIIGPYRNQERFLDILKF